MSESEIEQPVIEDAPAAEASPAEESAEAGALPDIEPEQLGLLDRPEAAESEEARLKAVLEAVVYVTDEPLTSLQIAQALGQLLNQLIRSTSSADADPCGHREWPCDTRHSAGARPH